MDKSMLSKATLGRLPEYLGFLRDLPEETEYISSTSIANALKLGEVQVRKDLNQTSGAGKPKVGYEKRELIKTLETHLGVNRQTKAVLVGAGKLGRALIDYEEFKKYGVEIAAAFAGSFCIGKCNRIGVTIQIDDDIHTGVTREGFKEFFAENVLKKLGRE